MPAHAVGTGTPQDYVTGEVIVKLKPQQSSAFTSLLRQQHGYQLQQRFQNSTFERWQLPTDQSVSEALATLQASDLVTYAEPNYIWQKHKLPNDPLLAQSWALNNIGQTVPSANEQGELIYINGTPGADLDLRQAWAITTGRHDVVIAIIDDGIDMDHPDLRANLWVNPDEISNDGLNHDGNDYIPIYPASYQNANILAVSASTATGKAATWAHHGQTSVDLAAPGASVFLPTDPDTTETGAVYKDGFHFYGYTQGTSFSALYVAGVAALLKTHYPNADYIDPSVTTTL